MTQTITRRATAAGLMLIASAILITGIAGRFGVLVLTFAGVAGLALMGELDTLRERFSFKGYGLGLLL